MGFDILKKNDNCSQHGMATSNECDKCLGDSTTIAEFTNNQLKQRLGSTNHCDDRVPEEEDEDEMSNENLDSGYAWLILVIMFLLQSSISGSSRVYGLVYAKEVAINYYDREQASWPIATASAVENLAGILTPTLASYLSWRKIELLSTSLLVSANLLAYYSSSLTLDIIALGFVQGLALSTCTVLSLVINNDYFERYRTTAYGISMSGSAFGVLYLTPLVSWLLENYENFRVVYLVLAIVFCVNMFLVLFIKPRAKTIKKRAQRGDKNLGDKNGADSLETDMEIEKVRSILETIEKDSKLKSGSSHDTSAGATLRLQVTRKRSRFESHFERKSSIASISYQARSRRQSVLSRQHFTPASASHSQQHANIYSIDMANRVDSPRLSQVEHANLQRMITKSQSGIELALADAISKHPKQLHKSSVMSMRSHPVGIIGDKPSIESEQQERLQRQISKLSISTSINSLSTGRGDTNNVRESNQEIDNQSELADCKAHGLSTVYNHDTDAQLIERSGQRSSINAVELENGFVDVSSPSVMLQTRQQYLVNCATAADTSKQKMASVEYVEGVVEQKQPDDAGKFSMDRTLKLLKLPYLHCTWIMLAIYYLVARIFVIILVDFAVDHGFSMSESTSLLNYWSIGELCGRIVLAPLIDLQYLSCKNCIVLTCTLLAASIACIVLIESYVVYAICSMSIAALVSLEYMLINVLMVEYMGKDQVTNCYSLAACISSLVLFSRPTLIGLFRDHLGSYDGLLVLLAVFTFAFSVIFCLLEPILIRYWPKKVILR